jgi:Holliday junction resolvase RusA-like endonuclease
MCKLTIPWEYVVSKNDKLTVVNGRPRLSTKYSKAKDAICWLGKGVWGKPATWPVTVEVLVFPPNRRHYDIFNVTQLIFDGLQGAAYEDDFQIDYGAVKRMDIDKDNPRVEVTVKPFTDSLPSSTRDGTL